MQRKRNRAKAYNLMLALFAGGVAFFVSMKLGPYYINGDQEYYRYLYENTWKFNLREGYAFYSATINSKEFVHFFAIWVFGGWLDKDLFVALSNMVLVGVGFMALVKCGANRAVALIVVLTNYYFFVLMFPAERLKYAAIFMMLAVCFSKSRFVRISSWGLAVLTHIQSLIVLFVVIAGSKKISLKAFLQNFFYSMLGFFALSASLYFVLPQIMVKSSLLGAREFEELLKFFLLFIIALYYSNNKKRVFIIFSPLLLATFMLGGGRVNMISYFVTLFLCVERRGGWNLGVWVPNVYFAFQTKSFIERVVLYGSAFQF